MLIYNKIVGALMLLSIASFLQTQPVYAQVSGAAKVYRTQFTDLHSKVKVLFARVEQQGRTKINPRDKLNLREEILALSTLINGLGIEAARSNVDILVKGQDSDKTLLLISQGCEAISFVLMAIDNFIDTEDRAFLGFAKDGEEIVKTIEKIM